MNLGGTMEPERHACIVFGKCDAAFPKRLDVDVLHQSKDDGQTRSMLRHLASKAHDRPEDAIEEELTFNIVVGGLPSLFCLG